MNMKLKPVHLWLFELLIMDHRHYSVHYYLAQVNWWPSFYVERCYYPECRESDLKKKCGILIAFQPLPSPVSWKIRRGLGPGPLQILGRRKGPNTRMKVWTMNTGLEWNAEPRSVKCYWHVERWLLHLSVMRSFYHYNDKRSYSWRNRNRMWLGCQSKSARQM